MENYYSGHEMEIDINALTDEQLSNLRSEIVLCSYFYNDYSNSYGIEKHSCCDFFDGYTEYLEQLMIDDGYDDDDFFKLLDEYDNIENLSTYYNYIDFTTLKTEKEMEQ